jgi:uncharacterized membrane protein
MRLRRVHTHGGPGVYPACSHLSRTSVFEPKTGKRAPSSPPPARHRLSSESGAASLAGMSKGRLEAFSDGVFAIAITLLALTLPDPDGRKGLGHQLVHNWPSYGAFLVSFLIIGVIWINHHALIGRANEISRSALLANLGLLLSVVSIPYVTRLLAEYLRAGGWDARVAAVLFSSVMLWMGVSFLVLFDCLGRADHVASDPTYRATRRRFGVGNIVYLGTLGLSFLSAPLTLAVHFLVVVYYLFDRLADPAQAESDSKEGATP